MLQVGKTYDSVSLQNDLDAIAHQSMPQSSLKFNKSKIVHLSLLSLNSQLHTV